MIIQEPLAGGQVNTADPAALAPGELQDGSNFWYVGNRANVIQAPAMATATLSGTIACYGITPVTFDNGTQYLITALDTKYQYSEITASSGALGAWADLGSYASSTARNSVEAIHYNNKYYLLDGVQDNLVIRQGLATRKHGLKAVIKACEAVTATASSNIWPGLATGYFDYWYTEVLESSGSPEDIVIESAYEATTTDANSSGAATPAVNLSGPSADAARIMVARVFIPTLAYTVNVKLPAEPRNPTATHYYLYRSEAASDIGAPTFPIGGMIGRFAITNAEIIVNDGVVTTSAYFYPSAAATAVGDVTQGLSWVNPSNAASINVGQFTDGTEALVNTTNQVLSFDGANIALSGFSITGISDPITRISVEVRARDFNSLRVELFAQLSFDAGVSWTAGRYLTVNGVAELTGSYQTLSTGYQTWGRVSLASSDVSNTNFRVRIAMTCNSNGGSISGSILGLDGVRVQIEGNGTSGIQIKPYPGIVLTQGRQNFVCSRNGQPPIAKTGCIFQGSLVTNDAAAPSLLRWSVPGDPEAFPTLYYLPIETKHNDQITYIGTVNNVCVVGLNNSIIRLNYLPTEDDASFSRSRIYDFISTTQGIIHQRAATTFLTPDGRELMACITKDGIYVTDGFTISKWDADYDFWPIVSNITFNNHSLHDPRWSSLVNDVGTGNLLLTYNSSEGLLRVIPYAYSPRHIKEGPRFKVGFTWQPAIDCSDGTFTTALTTLNGIPALYWAQNTTTTASTIVKLSDLGSLNYSTASTASLRTRDVTISNGQKEALIMSVYLHSGDGAVASTTITPYSRRLGQGTLTGSTASFQGTSSPITKADLDFMGYATSFLIDCPSTGLRRYRQLDIEVREVEQ